MQNLRITNVKVIDSSNIDVFFTLNLTSNLTISNVEIVSESSNIPNSKVLSIKVNNNSLSIECNPLSSLANYYLVFKSTPNHPFISINNTAKILEDGNANQYLITAPIDPSNPIKDNLNSFYQDNIYNTYDDTKVTSKYLKALSINLAKALYDIKQVKNENYLSFTVVDEEKVRGEGPSDRLNEESAYQIIRVGQTQTNSVSVMNMVFSEFPTNQISLQKQDNFEILTADSIDEAGKFNINTLTFNLNKNPIIKVNKITFEFASANPTYIYDIVSLGYQLKDSKYDKNYSFTYLLLEDNQVRISDKVLEDPLFTLNSLLNVKIEYEYKNLGITLDSSTINVYNSESSIRETLPPIVNVFSLKHAPIIDSSKNTATLAGVTFTDPNSNIPGAKHPAFITELPFRLNRSPICTWTVCYRL